MAAPTPTISVLEQLQLDMVGRAQAHAPLANVFIAGIRPRDQQSAVLIQTNLDKVLAGLATTAGKNGAAVLIQLPSGSIPHQEVAGPDFQLTYVARVFETPVINMGATGTGISAEDIMLLVINLFHRWFVANLGSTMLADKRPFEPVLSYLEQGKIVYDCFFTVRLGIQGMPKAQLPKFTYSEAGLTIASAGATIYYTTDGSYPAPQNAAAMVFAGELLGQDDQPVENQEGQPVLVDAPPINNLPSGTGVRAVAYAPNKQASDCAYTVIP